MRGITGVFIVFLAVQGSPRWKEFWSTPGAITSDTPERSVINALVLVPGDVVEFLENLKNKRVTDFNKIVQTVTQMLEPSTPSGLVDFKAFFWSYYILYDRNAVAKLRDASNGMVRLSAKSITNNLIPAMDKFGIDEHIFEKLNIFPVVPIDIIHGERISIPAWNLLPLISSGRNRVVRRILPVGDFRPRSPYANIVKIIESISVEQRSYVLHNIITTPAKITELFEHSYMDELSPDTRLYAEFVIYQAFIDPTILRLLYRFGTLNLRKDEKHLASAIDIMEHYQFKFKDGRFNYLTPDYLMTWLEHLRAGKLRLNAPADETQRLSILREDNTGDPARLVGITDPLFRDTLRRRLERLQVTGYELSI